jgi:hypothetical protein
MAAANRIITPQHQFGYEYSICTLVTDWSEYEIMKASFVEAGFDGNSTEYIVADNTKGNSFDAYEALNRFLSEARGAVTILVHQDVRCIDSKMRLDQILKDLSKQHEKWAVCGNAGANGYHREFTYLNNAGKEIKTVNQPEIVNSLDENFLVVNSRYRFGLSYNIGDFHFYGTDLAQHAMFSGLQCYVIPFLVNHLSLGNLEALEKATKGFVASYGTKFESRFVQTTCTKFYLSGSRLGNKFFNTPFVFFWVKFWQRLKSLFRIF